MMEALSSAERSVLTRSARHNSPEDAIIQNTSSLQKVGIFYYLEFWTMDKVHKPNVL
jgi:hypothetical protein